MRVAVGNRGFTLVELMVVVVIIGITSAVMVAEMQGTFEDALLKTTAHKIMDACDAASNRAISARETQLLKIDSKGGRYTIVPKMPPTEGAEDKGIDTGGAAGELDTRILLSIREPQNSGEEFDENLAVAEERERKARADVITFYADGTCDAREFFLKDRAGVEMVLRINPITSRVRILEMGAE